MKKIKTREEVKQHKNDSINTLNTYLDTLIDSINANQNLKADKLSYWINDWVTFLDYESAFSPSSLRRYKRGEIIKVHLGFNIGSEEGGLHYAVVLDKENTKSSPVITIVPLTSVKETTDIANLKKGSIFLGNDLFTNLSAKVSSTRKFLTDELDLMDKLLNDRIANGSTRAEVNEMQIRIDAATEKINLLSRMKCEVQKMKSGSIALVNQITTISKIRIYDPKTDHDILSNIKLSNEKLDLIDNEIRKNFTSI